jgi:imidazolonepropionase-like amidohydrolase
MRAAPNVQNGLSIAGARILDGEGQFSAPRSVQISGGLFRSFDAPTSGDLVLNATGTWMVPGIYDCHTHISWNDFYREDRERRGAAENAERTAKSVEATLRGGMTSARDAGGADAALQAAIASGSLIGPHLQISVNMIGPADAGSPSAMRGAVQTAIDKGAQWIKLLATAGSSTPSDEVLRSNFTREEFYAATDTALRGGARVMVHTWGGDSADWAIEAGATSLEHGIFLTRNQVTRAAAAGAHPDDLPARSRHGRRRRPRKYSPSAHYRCPRRARRRRPTRP